MDRSTIPNGHGKDNPSSLGPSVDKKLLPSFKQKKSTLHEICRVCWMEALNTTECPQENDSFLMSGGNSLAAMSLISKIRRLGKVDIQIRDILMNPVYNEFLDVVLNASNVEEVEIQHKDSTRLSAAQKRMLVIQEYSPTSTAYVESYAIITKLGSNKKVEDVFENLLLIHPELRTEINLNPKTGEYVREIYPFSKIDVSFESVTEEEDIAKYINKCIPTMSIISSPLIKCRCLQRNNSTVLVIQIHHIIEDAITIGRVINDLIKILNNEDVWSAPVAYSGYVDSEEQYLRSTEYTADELFWRKRYQTLPTLTTLSCMPLSEAIWKDTVVYTARHKYKEFGHENIKQICQTIRDLGITEFIYYLACTVLVLHRYIGVDDFAIAIPTSLRDDLHQTTDGIFLNTLLFRIEINLELTFREHFLRIANDWWLAQNSCRYPLDRLTHWMLTTKKTSMNSVCSIIFNYNMRMPAEEEIKMFSKHAKVPLILNFHANERNGRRGLWLEWTDELLNSSMIERLGDSIAMTCSENIRIDDRITDFEVLSPSELALLRSFSSDSLNQTPLSTEDEMHIQFERHAKRFPENTVVVFDQGTVTYAELNQMASRIAHCITTEVCPETLKSNPVMLFSKRDICSVAMLIGVWKSGGYFLPVSASISKRRSLEDIACRFSPAAIIYHCTEDDYKTLLEAKFTCPIIKIETTQEYKYESYLWSEKLPEIKANKRAYSLRTSGTTGVPKVLTISHHNLNVISNAWKIALNMEEYQVNVFQWVLLSFGVFINDVVRALICVPGRLVMCPDDKRLDVLYITNRINTENITLMEVTPHFASYLIENANTREFSSLKVVILSSDVTHTNVFQKVRHFLRPHQRVINGYGMTEATNDTTYFEESFIPSSRSGTVPIGKPLPGLLVHVCDPKTLQPAPVGTIGELYISGEVIASGEVNIVMLGNDRRVALKTGDLCCWLPCGNLDILGRSDNVIKIRGFRISTAEIEEQMTKHIPSIKESCVTVLSDNTPDKRQYVCAYVVADQSHCPNSRTIKQILSHELPHYMIPDIIHFCEELPETIHGKIDKKALPFLVSNDDYQYTNKTEYINDKDSKTMLVLKNLFAQAMEIEDILFIKNKLTFRENGASSLTLVRFYSLIRRKTEFKIEIADLFSYPSFCCLENYIDQEKQSSADRTENKEPFVETTDEIAITGLGIRLPSGIQSLSQFWEVLEKGEDVVHTFPDNRSKDVKECSTSIDTEEKNKGAFFDRIDLFDNDFFHISPDEAKFMSPEQRMFLQVATEALLEARNINEINGSNIGVYLGNVDVGYSRLDYPEDAKCLAGLVPGMVASRVAYQWNLKGPNMLVDTACASSLMALKLASESIQRNECEGALVGGVNLLIYPDHMATFGDAEMPSPEFCCRPFDENANGTVLGEGVLCLYIERQSSALEQGKHIYGIIKSVTSKNVGRGNGITAPSATSQVKTIKAALAAANVQASDVHYVEAHGTATKLGDSIEISALSSVYQEKLTIGASKGMFGHLNTASGLLGVIKVLAALMFNKIPPSAHFTSPIRELKDSQLYVVNAVENWIADASGRRNAGVTAIGLTGTSCHTIISDYICERTKTQVRHHLTSVPLLFRGKSFNHIKRQARLYNNLIKETIQKRQLNTLEGLCAKVAKKLRDLSDAGLGHTDFRMVVTVKTTDQVSQLLCLIQSLEQSEDLASVSNKRDDIHISFPGITNVTVDAKHVRSFLYNDHIDIYEIFGKDLGNIISVFGVTLSLYEESRHWLDPSDMYEESRHWLDPSDKQHLQHKRLPRVLERKTPEEERTCLI